MLTVESSSPQSQRRRPLLFSIGRIATRNLSADRRCLSRMCGLVARPYFVHEEALTGIGEVNNTTRGEALSIKT